MAEYQLAQVNIGRIKATLDEAFQRSIDWSSFEPRPAA